MVKCIVFTQGRLERKTCHNGLDYIVFGNCFGVEHYWCL